MKQNLNWILLNKSRGQLLSKNERHQLSPGVATNGVRDRGPAPFYGVSG